MATFTLELREVIEITGGTLETDDNGVTRMTGGDIGLGSYTCFEPAHKDILTGKIIDHYLFQEIGHETLELFQHQMRVKMNEIMPYYNKLYQTETIQFDPLSTIKLHTLATASEKEVVDTEGNSTNNSTTKAKSRTTNLVMPQTSLSGDSDYATSGVDAHSDSSGDSDGTQSTLTDSDKDTDTESTTEGYQAYPSNLIQQYRDIILNIDMMIVADLQELFMSIWNTNDSYTSSSPGWYGFGYGYGY